MLPAGIAQPDREAVEKKKITVAVVTLGGIGDVERFLNGSPIIRAVETMSRNSRRHLGVGRVCGGETDGAQRVCAEGLCETAFAAACAADDERSHGRGERASQFRSRDALAEVGKKRIPETPGMHPLSSEAWRKRHSPRQVS